MTRISKSWQPGLRTSRDSRGVAIEPDQLVAYNRSGDVVLGRIIDVQPSHIKISPVDQGRSHVERISRVKRGHSLVVLTAACGSIPLPVA